MSFLAKLFINGRKINVLDTNIQFYQSVSYNTFKPSSLPKGGIFTVTLEADSKTDLLGLALAHDTMCNGYIQFYKRDGMSKLTDYEFFDTYIVNYQRNFNGYSTTTDTFVFSPGILRIGDMVFEKPWKLTDLNNLANNIPPQPITPKPKLSSVKWKTVDGESIKETTYKEKVALKVKVANAEGGSVEITIEKEDGTEFEKGTKSLTFTEYLTDEGTAQISSLKIKEQWNLFRSSETDGLIAKVTHKGSKKESVSLKVIPPPEIIVEFRPNDNWKGEFGFDWVRKNDTTLFGDSDYEDLISKQYTDSAHTKLEKDGNAFKGFFKKDPKQFEELKKEYENFTLPWAKTDAKGNQTPEDYLIPWMSLYKNQEAKVKLILDIKEKGDYLEFESNPNFTITPNTFDISGKKGKVKPKDEFIIKCTEEFTTDQTITINACQKDSKGNITEIEAGKIQFWANDATKRKEKKVVFVQIKTPPLSNKFELLGNAQKEKKRIGQYLKQALITLHKDSDIVDLDLSSNKDFANFIVSKKISPANTKDKSKLKDFLRKELSSSFKKKYDNHFKAFYFAENGYHKSGGLLSGYSQFGADFVVVFASANDQTAAHEFLHALNLAHSFSNEEASSNAKFTYKFKETENLLDYSHHITAHKNDRCSLWYWQWVKANNSIT